MTFSRILRHHHPRSAIFAVALRRVRHCKIAIEVLSRLQQPRPPHRHVAFIRPALTRIHLAWLAYAGSSSLAFGSLGGLTLNVIVRPRSCLVPCCWAKPPVSHLFLHQRNKVFHSAIAQSGCWFCDSSRSAVLRVTHFGPHECPTWDLLIGGLCIQDRRQEVTLSQARSGGSAGAGGRKHPP